MTVAKTRSWGALASIVFGAALAAALAGCEGEQAWMTYTADDGLAHDAVESVEIGRDGVVWAGTHAGLSRFDGQEWMTFSHREDAPISSRADEVAVDADGEAWVASWEGVASFNGERWTSHGEADGLPDWPVTAVAVTDDEVLAASDAVYRFDGQRWQRMDGSPREVGSLAVADDGIVWAAVDTVSDGEALFEFDGQDWHTHVTRENADVDADGSSGEVVPGRLIRSVAVDDDGVLWAGTDQGVASYDGQGWSHHTVDDGLPHDGVRAVAVDGADHVWVATLDDGVPDPDHAVARFDRQQWTTYTTNDGLPDGWVNDLTVDDDGTVWAATAAGLARLARDG